MSVQQRGQPITRFLRRTNAVTANNSVWTTVGDAGATNNSSDNNNNNNNNNNSSISSGTGVATHGTPDLRLLRKRQPAAVTTSPSPQPPAVSPSTAIATSASAVTALGRSSMPQPKTPLRATTATATASTLHDGTPRPNPNPDPNPTDTDSLVIGWRSSPPLVRLMRLQQDLEKHIAPTAAVQLDSLMRLSASPLPAQASTVAAAAAVTPIRNTVPAATDSHWMELTAWPKDAWTPVPSPLSTSATTEAPSSAATNRTISTRSSTSKAFTKRSRAFHSPASAAPTTAEHHSVTAETSKSSKRHRNTTDTASDDNSSLRALLQQYTEATRPPPTPMTIAPSALVNTTASPPRRKSGSSRSSTAAPISQLGLSPPSQQQHHSILSLSFDSSSDKFLVTNVSPSSILAASPAPGTTTTAGSKSTSAVVISPVMQRKFMGSMDPFAPVTRIEESIEPQRFTTTSREKTTPSVPSAAIPSHVPPSEHQTTSSPRRSPRIAGKRGLHTFQDVPLLPQQTLVLPLREEQPPSPARSSPTPTIKKTARFQVADTELDMPAKPMPGSAASAEDEFHLDDNVLAGLPVELLSSQSTQPAPPPPLPLPPAPAMSQSEPPVAIWGSGIPEDDDDMLFAHLDLGNTCATTTSSAKLLPSEPKSRAVIYDRFIVLDVIFHDPSMTLKVLQERSGFEGFVTLADDWARETLVSVGDHVTVVGEFDASHHCMISAVGNLLVVHPDCLISGTTLADAFPCPRKPVLAELHRSLGEATPAIVFGSMTHTLFEQSLRRNDFSAATLQADIDKLIQGGAEMLYAAHVDEPQAREQLTNNIEAIQQFADRYVVPQPRTSVRAEGRLRQESMEQLVSVDKVLDIEENVWSPKYGLKGKIDATVEVKIHKRPLRGSREATQLSTRERAVAPLELKTGKDNTSASHRAQVTLYTLLLSDRYDINIDSGLLFYLKSGEVIRIASSWGEVSSLIIQRNHLASHLVRNELPKMNPSDYRCKQCHQLDRCLTYHKLMEGGTEESSGLGSLFTERTQHLLPSHAEFLSKWNRLITLELGDINFTRKQIWLNTSSERELLGACLSKMEVDEIVSNSATAQLKLDRLAFVYRFRKSSTADPKDDRASFPLVSQLWNSRSPMKTQQRILGDGHFAVGDPVVVSSEAGHFALAIGFVKDVATKTVTLSLDRDLFGDPSLSQEDGFAGLWSFKPDGTIQRGTRNPHKSLFRIDRDELAAGLGLIRSNLINLFTADGDSKRRRLIVDGEPPLFAPRERFDEIRLMLPDWSGLNGDQQSAVEKVFMAEDYVLILGMPGTGKTTTIAKLIRYLVLMKKTVLLTSYTHSAVDNILLRLLEEDKSASFLRLGNADKVHPTITAYSDRSMQRQQANLTVQQLRDLYENTPIVATTCLGINHALFLNRRFDYCIVDEASQVTQPVCFGPLSRAEKFVLVGDHYQLPPLVRNSEAKRGGYDVSLFEHLSERHPHAIVSLRHQYRMNYEIMMLANELVYGGRLQCGTESVARARLALPTMADFVEKHVSTPQCIPGLCWLDRALDPANPVVFLDTDAVPAEETKIGDLVRNPGEADLTLDVVEALVAAGVPDERIGVISPYRAQLRLLRDRLQGRPNVEILTVDRSQGRQKACIVLSLVRSNTQQKVGDLLRDWRRVNVAITRAELKLIIIGSRSTLEGSSLFVIMSGVLASNHWIIKLPKDAHHAHGFLRPPTVLSQARALSQAFASGERQFTPRKLMRQVPDDPVPVPAHSTIGAEIDDAPVAPHDEPMATMGWEPADLNLVMQAELEIQKETMMEERVPEETTEDDVDPKPSVTTAVADAAGASVDDNDDDDDDDKMDFTWLDSLDTDSFQ